uniref:Innexin n=1 Tax=Globodera rostochiensis TaxID=31243 RepID=A0A914HI00_GLORO
MFFLDKFLQGLKPQFDDDIVDRLNYYYTPMLFIVFALTLSAKQYVGQPIQCWIPAQFTGAWEQYSENYCFVQNTYFLPLNHYIPQDIEQREEKEIGYYQWVPFVLGLQGILFYLPSLVWRIFNWQSGVAVKGIIQMCEDVGNMQVDKRRSSVEVVATHIRDSLKMQQTLSKGFLLSCLFRRGTYLNWLYLVIKMLYLFQVVCQFFVLNSFLGTSYTFWGFEILRDLAHGHEWQESGHFPRVTMCDFEVRVLGNKHRHTVQCVLMINMFNEKVYLFVWWWLLLVGVATFLSFTYWLTTPRQNEDDPNEKRAIGKFVNSYLRSDGVFLLRLISSNAGDLITTDIVFQLWHMFLTEEAARAQSLREPLGKVEEVSGGNQKSLEDVDNADEKQRLTIS